MGSLLWVHYWHNFSVRPGKMWSNGHIYSCETANLLGLIAAQQLTQKLRPSVFYKYVNSEVPSYRLQITFLAP